MAEEIVLPRTPTEQAVCDIWKELLDREEIGIDDKFFEIGGSSMHVVLMVSLLDEQFPGRVKAPDLFDRPTVRLIAEFLDGEPADTEAVGVEL